MKLKFDQIHTNSLTKTEFQEIINLCNSAFPFDFEPIGKIWKKVGGGVHIRAKNEEGELAGHCLITKRTFKIEDRLYKAAYVDSVAVHPDFQKKGVGGKVMKSAEEYASEKGFEICGLSTSIQKWYAKFGWEVWKGPLALDKEGEIIHTPDEEGDVMILRLPFSERVPNTCQLTASWRPGTGW